MHHQQLTRFQLEYVRRQAGREVSHTGTYVTFEYNPMRNAYRAIVRPTGALGLHAVELADITNLQAFSDYLAARGAQRQQSAPRPSGEIPLPMGDTKMCQLAGIDATPYT